jgi:hypothetical protein
MAAPIEIKMEIVGLKEIQQALKELPSTVATQVLRSFHRKILTDTVVKPMRAALPYSRRTTKNIQVWGDRSKKDAAIAAPSTDSFWLRFVEKGTVTRILKKPHVAMMANWGIGEVKWRTLKKGTKFGKVKATHHMESFIDSQIQTILKKYGVDMGEEMIKIIEKRVKKIKVTK